MKKIIPIIILVLALCQAGAFGVWADDTDIYQTSTISVKPNVLIIFDTSGSMSTVDVPGEYYDPATTYPGPWITNAVYRYKDGAYVSPAFTGDVNNITCASVKNALLTQGRVVADGTKGINKINTTTFACGSSSRTLRLGNWRNYDATGASAPSSRISVAIDAIKNLINTTEFEDDGSGGGIAGNGILDGGELLNVRFGLMRFNRNDSDTNSGGRIVKNIGTSKAELIAAVDALTADGWTPLAETMAEAGLYYAGKASWFNTGVTYTSPIENRCQKNYIILMTDGEPTNDNHTKLTTGLYINNNVIADYDLDGSSGKLDDVTKYLYDNDLRSDLGVPGESFQSQNIITYTIGFTSDQTLLQNAALNGGGRYYTTSSASGLTAAFEEIMSSIADVNAVFVSPVVPVSKMNRTFAGNSLYVGFFKPDDSGRWLGNIKKYGLDSHGEIIDKFGVAATLADGSIKENATSFWSGSPDGPNVLAGGVGGMVVEQTSRNLYTNMVAGSLTQSGNAFSKTNAAITAAVLDVGTTAARDAVIDDIHGEGKAWVLGDILHSQPAVIHYTVGPSYIFSGSNDGMMHCYNDSTGEEQWGFIPYDHLGNLKRLSDATPLHDYFVDGTSVVYSGTSQKILFFGERRGGNNYYALDVTAPTSPFFIYKIVTSGQSWSTPTIAKIKTVSGSDTVFLMGGGYDNNQDLDSPAASDTGGRAVFAIKVADGSVSSLNMNNGNYPDMTHSILDVAGFDIKWNDGYVDRVYAGDLGGKVFAFEDVNRDASWSGRTFFSASADGVQRKIFYAPDAVAESYGEMIFFGTGDREHPDENTVVNRIYAIKNKWTVPAPAMLTESDLTDVTNDWIVIGTAEQRAAVKAALASSEGWYIRLEHLGEKVTSSPVVYAGKAYFTTYTPEPVGGGGPADPCEAASGRGQARLYAVDYLTGEAVYNFYAPTEKDTSEVDLALDKLGKEDRSKLIGTSMPSAPVIAVLEEGAKLFVGVEGGVASQNLDPVTDLNLFYWRQITN